MTTLAEFTVEDQNKTNIKVVCHWRLMKGVGSWEALGPKMENQLLAPK